MEKTFNLNTARSLAASAGNAVGTSTDYILKRFKASDSHSKMASAECYPDGPMRVDGLGFVLCFDGSIRLNVNLTDCDMTANTITVIPPGSIVEVLHLDLADTDCYMMLISTDFLHTMNFDLSVVGTLTAAGLREQMERVMQLSESEADLVREYLDLLSRNADVAPSTPYTKSIARCLFAALSYQLMQTVSERIRPDEGDAQRKPSRRNTYVREFMQLVHQHHRRERAVAFYADKLFISPKYLTLLVREHTGRTAAEIIDQHVLLEAKNLLRFSGKNVQQVAYELNFSTQSSFGKFFKNLTGMSPTQYMRS